MFPVKRLTVLFGATASLALAPMASCFASDLGQAVDASYPYVRDHYEYFHQNPELSLKEKESAARIAVELEAMGFKVTERVGDKWVKKKVRDLGLDLGENVGGYGVVAVLENGDGPTLMIRADMDALPLAERTGVPYISKVVSTDFKGQSAPVMHACAHDAHMAAMLGTARLLTDMKEGWSGTLIMVAQPAEEIGLGAIAMIEGGLYEKFPKPDFVIAQHTTGWLPSGVVGYTPGYALANVDSVDIHVKGVGAHGSTPHLGKDPIVLGANIVTALQTLVSREMDTQESGVVTVGSFQAGYKHNIIPDGAHLQITVRSYTDEVRSDLLEGIKRIAEAQALSAGLPPDLAPVVEIEPDYTPSTYNDPDLTARIMGAISAEIGDEQVKKIRPSMGGEDFSQFSRMADMEIPSVIFWVGGSDPEMVAKAAAGDGLAPPSNHSPFFAPQAEPALKTGVKALTAAAVELLKAQ